MTLSDVSKGIGKVPLLSAEEEVELSKRIEKGDKAKQLAEANLRLVVSIAKICGRGMLFWTLFKKAIWSHEGSGKV